MGYGVYAKVSRDLGCRVWVLFHGVRIFSLVFSLQVMFFGWFSSRIETPIKTQNENLIELCLRFFLWISMCDPYLRLEGFWDSPCDMV